MIETAIDQFAQLDLDTEEEIEVIYVESLSPVEIVDFARFGELQVLEELDRLDLVPRLFSAIDGRGNTALHVAAANGHLDIVDYILSLLKADNREYINKINEQGNTALHWASLNGHVEVVKALLAAGADHSVKVSQAFIRFLMFACVDKESG